MPRDAAHTLGIGINTIGNMVTTLNPLYFGNIGNILNIFCDRYPTFFGYGYHTGTGNIGNNITRDSAGTPRYLNIFLDGYGHHTGTGIGNNSHLGNIMDHNNFHATGGPGNNNILGNMGTRDSAMPWHPNTFWYRYHTGTTIILLLGNNIILLDGYPTHTWITIILLIITGIGIIPNTLIGIGTNITGINILGNTNIPTNNEDSVPTIQSPRPPTPKKE